MPPKPELLGVSTINEKGQIVIPSEARNKLGLKSGDKLLVFTDKREGLMLAKAETIEKITTEITEHMADWKAEIDKVKEDKTD